MIASAATVHVPEDQPTIQAGIDAAIEGDSVVVASGTYTWTSEGTGAEHLEGDHGLSLIHLKHGVHLTSATGDPEDVTIDAQQQGRVVICGYNGLHSSITGITIQGGLARYGGGLKCLDNGPIVSHCIFNRNTATDCGGAAYFSPCTTALTDCTFIDNYASSCGAVCSHTGPGGMVEYRYCVFNANSTTGAGIITVGNLSSVRLVGCTLVANSVHHSSPFDYAVIQRSEFSSLDIHSSIIAFNTSGQALTDGQPEANLDINCCNFFGNPGGDWVGSLIDQLGINGNICEDPQFCGSEASASPYSISDSSPCAPSNNTCGLLIGALPVACTLTGIETSAELRSWSGIKALY